MQLFDPHSSVVLLHRSVKSTVTAAVMPPPANFILMPNVILALVVEIVRCVFTNLPKASRKASAFKAELHYYQACFTIVRNKK